MDGKVLIFVRDYQLKRQVINLTAQLGLSFVECNEMAELNFRMQLIMAENKLFVYEFAEGIDEEKQFIKLKSMKEAGWKTLVIFSKYHIPYIDKSQNVGINDLVIHPVEIVAIKNKIISLLSVPIETKATEETISEEASIDEIVKLEINRAQRGDYALSFVIFELSSVVLSKQKNFIEQLKNRLRETDAVIRGREKDTYLIMCPFTPKNFVVEVENKIRSLFQELKIEGTIAPLSKLYVYGLTLGLDGEDFEQLITILEDSLHEFKVIDNAIKHNILHDPEKLKAYRSMYKR